MANKIVQKFIENNIDLIDEESWLTLFYAAYRELNSRDVETLTLILLDIGADTKEARLQVLADNIVGELNSFNALNDDPSNSWARLQYVLGATGRLGLTYQDIVNYLYKHEKLLNLNIHKITEPEYCWEMVPDYDLVGNFDREKFAKLYQD